MKPDDRIPRSAALLLVSSAVCLASFSQSCLTAFTFTPEPPPIGGEYTGGQLVQFCFTIDDWDQPGVNWFHGVVPSFAPGWDASSMVPGPPPLDCGGFGGTWLFSPSVTGTSPFSAGPVGPGWFYDLDNDGDPGNNLGDDCFGPWIFCWTITTNSGIDCIDGDDLTVWVDTYGDSETGSWGTPGCVGDTIAEMTTNLNCSGVGSDEAHLQGGNGVWPTAFSDGFFVDLGEHEASADLFDPSGRFIRSVANNAGRPAWIDRGDLVPGPYFLLVHSERGQRPALRFQLVAL